MNLAPSTDPTLHASDNAHCPRIVIGSTKTGFVRFERLHLLGRGGFARCFAFRNIDDPQLGIVAGKVVEKKSLVKQSSREKLASEIRIHRELNHLHVVRMQQYFEDDRNVYLVLDLCDGDTVYDVAKRRPGRRVAEHECRQFMHETGLALSYLHENNVIHRDLKLANLFLHQGSIKLGDFGLAARLDFADERKLTVCGTPNYLAPEIISDIGYSFEVDMWALGVCMFALLVGVPPFETTDVATTYRRIRSNDYAFDPNVVISAEAKSLVRRLLDPLPACRPPAASLSADPFFVGIAQPKTPIKHAPAVPRSPLRPLFAATNKPATPTRRIAVLPSEPPVVERFVDYSAKYGVGFALENGTFQACFNDLTRIALLGDDVRYWSHGDAASTPISCTVHEYPQELYKKVTLIKYFRDYLVEHGARASRCIVGGNGSDIDSLVSVLRFERNKRDATFFLSDGSAETHLVDEMLRVRVASSRRSAVLVGDDDGLTMTTIDLGANSVKFAALPPRVKRAIERLL